MLDDALAAFLEEGNVIHLGTRNAQLEPNGVRATAAFVDPDREHVVVYIPDIAAASVVEDLKANGQAAIVIGRPRDDHACQVKGTFVSVRAATSAEEAPVRAQWQALISQLGLVGMPGESMREWIVWPCRAVRIRATAVYSQTPGPNAGAQLS